MANKNFVMIPNALFEPKASARLKPIGIALIAALLRKRATPVLGPSNRYLAKMIGTTPAAVRHGLRLLDRAGMVRTIHHGRGCQDGYDLAKVIKALESGTGIDLIAPIDTHLEPDGHQTDSDLPPNSKTVSSTQDAKPDCSRENFRLLRGEGNTSDLGIGMLSAAPIETVPIREADLSEQGPVANHSQFGPSPNETEIGCRVLEVLFSTDAEQLWHETRTALFRDYGNAAVWKQINWLPTRLVNATTPVRKIAGYFIKSVQNDWAAPTGPFVDAARFEKWCEDRRIAKYAHDDCIPFACSITGGNCPDVDKRPTIPPDGDDDAVPF